MPVFSWVVVPPVEEAAPAVTLSNIGTAADLPRDLRLGADGDLELYANDLVFTSGQDAIEQDLASRLKIVRGEWFLDLDRGIPYFEDVFRKGPNLNAFRAELRAAIEATPGVVELLELTLTEDRAARTLSVDFKARTNVGDLVARALPLLEI